jgi:hypothetical protein
MRRAKLLRIWTEYCFLIYCGIQEFYIHSMIRPLNHNALTVIWQKMFFVGLPTFTASTFFCFISAAQWRYVNLATEVTKASLCVCMDITEVTCTADLNPCKHCNVAALSSLWSSVTLNAAIIGAQQTSIMNLKIVVSVITENTDLQNAQV